MPFLAPATIPTINYSTYNSYQPTPRPGAIPANLVYSDELTSMKVATRSILKQNKLSHKPLGFPFHAVSRINKFGDRSTEPSYASYNFREPIPDRRLGVWYATFSFIAPDLRRGSHMMTWAVSVPGRHSAYSPGNVAIAHVQVDPIVMETSLGIDIMTNPRIILEALALSIELGFLITIQVADRKPSNKYTPKRNMIYGPGEIIFLATDGHGNSEVVFVHC